MNKIDEFIKRNRKRNAHLYQSGLLQGYDYIVCPVSNERMSMVKSSYIEKVLGMTVLEYDQLYPGARTICSKRQDNIKTGLKQIDPNNGLTKYEIGQVKARQVLKEVDENGKSGYKRKGEKTKATHMSKIDTLGRNGYAQLASKAIIKGNQTKANKGLILQPGQRDEFYRYKTVIMYLTEKLRAEVTEGFVTGLAGKEGAYQIDHSFSIMQGYENRVSPLVIGHRLNLKMLPWKENLQKHSNSSCSLNEILFLTGYTKEKSESEFKKTIRLIQNDIVAGKPPNGAFLIERLYDTVLC